MVNKLSKTSSGLYVVEDSTPPPRIGFLSIRVLPQLHGQPFDENAHALIHTLRPSKVRATKGEITTDAWLWRVTVYLGHDELIESIEQEVQIALPDDCQNGHEFLVKMKKTGVGL